MRDLMMGSINFSSQSSVLPSVSLNDVLQAMANAGPAPTEWLLIAPDGRCYRGEDPIVLAAKAVHSHKPPQLDLFQGDQHG